MQKTFEKLLKFATLRPRSEKEIGLWFKRKNIEIDLQKELFSQLKKLGFVNDKEFIKWWIDQRLTFKHASKKRIVYELRQKGIKDSLIKQTIENTEFQEEEQAQKTLERKAKNVKTPLNQKDKVRLYGYLARQGFSWEVIKKAIDERFKER